MNDLTLPVKKLSNLFLNTDIMLMEQFSDMGTIGNLMTDWEH